LAAIFILTLLIYFCNHYILSEYQNKEALLRILFGFFTDNFA
jgi:hypothetical protein